VKPSVYDVWFLQANEVLQQVPYDVVTEWVQQAKLKPTDKIRTHGKTTWKLVSDDSLVGEFVSVPTPKVRSKQDAGDKESGGVALDFRWKNKHAVEDDDVDMIPLIDISLVLLIFFMMTATVASVSKIDVPKMKNAGKLDASPDIIRIDIDYVNKRPLYGIGIGSASPAEGDGELADGVAMLQRLDAMIGSRTTSVKVRLSAHGDVPYEIVEAVLNALEKRISGGIPISNVSVQVSDKP
jgi:biopolymer transport protein ExbD